MAKKTKDMWRGEAEKTIAEGLARAATSPFEVLSLLQQGPQDGTSTVAWGSVPGIGKYWTGTVLSCLRLACHRFLRVGVRYEAEEQLRAARRRVGGALLGKGAWWTTLAIACVASAGATVIAYPLTSLRVRLVAQMMRPNGAVLYSGMWDAFTRVFRTEGLRGLFIGVLPLVLGAVVFDVTAYFAYHALARVHSALFSSVREDDDAHEGSMTLFLRGCLAHAFGQALSHPFEFISRRMVIERVLHSTPGEEGERMMVLVRRVASEEGPHAFFKGLWPLLLRIVPYAALTILFHLLIKRLVSRLQERQARKQA